MNSRISRGGACHWRPPLARLPRTGREAARRSPPGAAAVKTAARFSLERIAALDRAVRAGEYPNAASLARRLEVGRRTVQRDVEFFRDRLGAPLAFDQRRNGYYYTEVAVHGPDCLLKAG